MANTSFLDSPSLLYSSESVTEGHPDKLCDQISDAVLDAIYAQDEYARVACESATTKGLVVLFGEITTTAHVDYEAIVRNKIREIGYDDQNSGIDYRTCRVQVEIHEQSSDISQAVSVSLEHREGSSEARAGRGELPEVDALGAGDQGMVVGFACNETPELMPLTIALSHRLTRQLAIARKEGEIPYLRPDGKAQVTVEYSYGRPKRIHTIVVSAQHAPGITSEKIHSDIQQRIIDRVVPPELMNAQTRVLVNPSGQFVVGGPQGDAGLTGRKILVDTYGGVARHGGGAFSGKDPTKVDRSAAYAARYVAKNLVAGGLADRCEVQISYAIGVAAPIAISVETFGTGYFEDEVINRVVRRQFDLRPGAIIRDLDLRRPIYSGTAAHGHFGRADLDLPWERTDRATLVRTDAESLR